MAKSGRPIRNLLIRDGRYYARLAVPLGLRKHVGKRELLRPLGGDRTVALKMLPGCVAEFQNILAYARKGMFPPPPAVSAPQAARDLYKRELDLDLMRRRHDSEYRESSIIYNNTRYLENFLQIAYGPILTIDFVDQDKRERNVALNHLADFISASPEDDEGQLDFIHREMNTNDTFVDATIGCDLEEACKDKAPPLRGSDEWMILVREIARAKSEFLLRVRERDAHNFSGRSIYDEDPSESESPVTLTDLLNRYGAELERSGRTIEMLKKGRVAIKSLATFVGHEDARKITRADVLSWVTNLRGSLSDKTVRDSYVASLKAVLSNAVDSGTITTNVASNLRLRVVKPTLVREKGYTRKEASRLLQFCSKYVPAADSDGAIREGHKLSLAKRWVPLLCAYTGARVAEICQLSKCDVYVDEAVPCIRITPEAGGTKDRNFRDVPLHRDLVERGFLTLVEGLPAGPLFFTPRNDRSGRTHPSKFVAGRISEWLQETGLVPRGKSPSHGFRHAFKCFGMEEGIEARVLDAIQGHVPRTGGEGYNNPSIPTKAAAIARMRAL